MTDTTGNPNIDPEGIDVETCLAQLRDPAILLAEALYRVHRADAAQAAADALGVPVTDADIDGGIALHDQREHLTRTADTLAYIAKAAADMAAQERQRVMTSIDDFLDDPEAMRAAPAHEYEPQAVNGVRFTVALTEGYRYLGVVAGREWVYLTGYGFADVTDFEQPTPEPGFTVSGRVVSATPDHVLCVTDGGTSVTLPRALIVESADE